MPERSLADVEPPRDGALRGVDGDELAAVRRRHVGEVAVGDMARPAGAPLTAISTVCFSAARSTTPIVLAS